MAQKFCCDGRCTGACSRAPHLYPIEYTESPLWGRVYYQPQPAAEVKNVKLSELIAKVKTFRRPNHYGQFCGCEACLLHAIVDKLHQTASGSILAIIETTEAAAEKDRKIAELEGKLLDMAKRGAAEIDALKAANKSANQSTEFAQKQLCTVEKQLVGAKDEIEFLKREKKVAMDERNAAVKHQCDLRDEAREMAEERRAKLAEVEKERDGLVRALAALGNKK